MSNKKLGYVLITLFLIIFAVFLCYAIRIVAFPQKQRVIAFDQVGNLRLDDPVKIKGVTVGKITNISRNTAYALVTFQMDVSLDLYKDYSIITSDRGIMGDRVIHIEPGIQKTFPLNENDTLKGVFIRGVSEMIGATWKLRDNITAIKSAAALLSDTAGKKSFITLFSIIIRDLDTVSNALYAVVTTIDSGLSSSLDTLSKTIVSIKKDYERFSVVLPEKFSAISDETDTLIAFLHTTDTLVGKLSDITTQIATHPLITGDDITPLRKDIDELRYLLYRIQIGAIHQVFS
jgi:ABC-type transporter Mla subunit MlaD